MKYIHEEFIEKDEIMAAEAQGYAINVRFCRTCPLFESNRIQYDSNVIQGWCRRMSYYEPLLEDNELPHYVYVNSNSFCNEDDIGNEENY